MNEQLSEAFEICLAALRAGSSLKDCLALYPQLSSELKPLLTTAIHAQHLHSQRVPARALHRSRSLFLRKARTLEQQPAWPFAGWGIPRLAMAAFSLLLVIFLSLNGLVVASAQTLPGDTLYAVKRAAETVRLQLVSDTEVKHRMENDYILRRAAEVKKLLALQRAAPITLEGRVDQVQDTHWVVEGIPVYVDASTILIGHIQPGDFIEVEGATNPSGWVDADELHQRYFNLSGVVQSIGQKSWAVGDLEVVIQKDTQFDPGLQIGDQALVLVYSSDDGNFYARAILNHPPAPFQPFEVQFAGLLESIDGQMLMIDGKQVATNAQTLFEGNLIPGVMVSIISQVAQDGSLTALSVQVEDDSPLEPVSGDDLNHEDEEIESDDGAPQGDDGGEADRDKDDDREEESRDDDSGDDDDDRQDDDDSDDDDDNDGGDNDEHDDDGEDGEDDKEDKEDDKED